MKKERIITLLGLIVIFVPMFGIPSSYKTIIFAALGLAIVILSMERKPKVAEQIPAEKISEAESDNIQV